MTIAGRGVRMSSDPVAPLAIRWQLWQVAPNTTTWASGCRGTSASSGGHWSGSAPSLASGSGRGGTSGTGAPAAGSWTWEVSCPTIANIPIAAAASANTTVPRINCSIAYSGPGAWGDAPSSVFRNFRKLVRRRLPAPRLGGQRRGCPAPPHLDLAADDRLSLTAVVRPHRLLGAERASIRPTNV